MVVSNWSGVAFKIASSPSTMIPALFTRTSRWSTIFANSATASRMLTGSDTSIFRNVAAGPIFCAAARPAFSLRAPTNTRKPFAASCRATSKPIPLFAPVTSAIFSDFGIMQTRASHYESQCHTVIPSRADNASPARTEGPLKCG